jgi:polysaccharide export outer membrane protein
MRGIRVTEIAEGRGVSVNRGMRAMSPSARLRVAALSGWLAIALACNSVGPLPPPETPSAEEPTYVIGVNDKIGINVWKNPELSLTVPVRGDGMISVPLLNDVKAAGLTPEQLRDKITEDLKAYITEPEVTVVVVEMLSKIVSVLGATQRTGTINWHKDMRVMEAIANAGGFTIWAKTNKVRVLRRQSDGTVAEYRFNYDAYLSGKSPESNFLLKAGDEIVVPD